MLFSFAVKVARKSIRIKPTCFLIYDLNRRRLTICRTEYNWAANPDLSTYVAEKLIFAIPKRLERRSQQWSTRYSHTVMQRVIIRQRIFYFFAFSTTLLFKCTWYFSLVRVQFFVCCTRYTCSVLWTASGLYFATSMCHTDNYGRGLPLYIVLNIYLIYN